MGQIIYVTKPTKLAEEARQKAALALAPLEAKLNTKLVVAVGGDGTMLKAIRDHSDEGALFAGISAGTLGLLATVEIDNIDQLVSAIAHRSYRQVSAPMLAACYCNPSHSSAAADKKEGVIGYGFNDISVERSGSRAAKFNLKIDASSGTFIGDGVLFCTPLGSTAYNLAAGGPIVDSRLQNLFVVTPNNPHFSMHYSSLQRPHILDAKRVVRITAEKDDLAGRPLQLIIDGHTAIAKLNKPVNIYLSARNVKLIQLNDHDMQTRIEAKRLGRL